MSDSKRREHICFTGYVQGVGFRYRLSHLAQYYGVTGWVRNEYDGSVSAELQGLVGEIDQIIQQLKQDRYIDITGMDRQNIPPDEQENGFHIRYKADKSRLPEGINEEMLAVSGKIADIDRQMQDMYLRIRAAETEKDE